MAVTYSYPGGAVAGAVFAGYPSGDFVTLTFPSATVQAHSITAAFRGVGGSLCAGMDDVAPPLISGYSGCGYFREGSTLNLVLYSMAGSNVQRFVLPLVEGPSSPSGVTSGGTVSGTVSLASGSTIKLDAGPTYSYADIAQFWGIAALALTAVWCVRQFVLKLVTPQ